MKNLMIFLAGIAVGAGGTLLWLYKDYEKKVEDEVEKVTFDMKKRAKEEARKDLEEERNKAREKAEQDYVEAAQSFSARLTDRLGYTNYAGETGSERVETRDFNDENDGFFGKNLEKIEEMSRVSEEKSEKNGEKSSENDENYVSLLKTKSGACARKSGALDTSNYKNDDFEEKIHGISPQDFVHTGRDFSKRTLIFYAKNGIFTDGCATFCANAPLLVGEKWRMEVGKYEENVAYIRNEKIGADYEIIVEDSAFEGEILEDEMEG